MAVTAHATGTHTSDGTETFVTSPNVAGTFQFVVDLNDMVDGDTVILKVYQMVLTGGTSRVLYTVRRDDIQPAEDKIVNVGPVSNELSDATSLRFSIQGTTTAGTISVPWKVLKFA